MPIAKNKKNRLPAPPPSMPKKRTVKKTGNPAEDDAIVGIWKDRFQDETPVEIGQRLRREPWTT